MVVYLGSGSLSCAVVLQVVGMGGVVSDLLLLRVLVSVLMNDVAVAVDHAAVIVMCIGVVIVEMQGQWSMSKIRGEELSLIEGRSV
jgi:hypothetical protein